MNARFWSHVDADGDCWVWTASRDRDGYGRFNAQRRDVKAHRFAYEDLVGPIPVGLQIDHLCRNRACVNPDHLEPVTAAVNVRRGFRMRSDATRCKYGHLWTADNTLMHRRTNGRLYRQCRQCWAAYFRKYRAQKKAVAA